MCSGDLEPQIFELSETEFDQYSEKWWKRVEQYHLNLT